MLTDIFADRYADRPIWTSVTSKERTLLTQMFRVASETLFPLYVAEKMVETSRQAWARINSRLSQELGRFDIAPVGLSKSLDDVRRAKAFFETESTGDPDRYMKERLSLIELALREKFALMNFRQRVIDDAKKPDSTTDLRLMAPRFEHEQDSVKHSYQQASEEVDVRLRRAGVPLSYDSGYFSITNDPLVQSTIVQPFWVTVTAPIWSTVSHEMHEAVDRLDASQVDAARYACNALESATRIISDQLKFTTGKEKGASNYIDNLNSSANGRFLDVWEGDLLRSLFRHVRNDISHGTGSLPPVVYSAQQSQMIVETCMSWIKLLVHRLDEKMRMPAPQAAP